MHDHGHEHVHVGAASGTHDAPTMRAGAAAAATRETTRRARAAVIWVQTHDPRGAVSDPPARRRPSPVSAGLRGPR